MDCFLCTTVFLVHMLSVILFSCIQDMEDDTDEEGVTTASSVGPTSEHGASRAKASKSKSKRSKRKPLRPSAASSGEKSSGEWEDV